MYDLKWRRLSAWESQHLSVNRSAAACTAPQEAQSFSVQCEVGDTDKAPPPQTGKGICSCCGAKVKIFGNASNLRTLITHCEINSINCEWS